MKRGLLLFFMLIFLSLSLAGCNQRKNVTGSGEILTVEYNSPMDIDSIRVSQIRMVKGRFIVPVEVNIYGGNEKKITLYGQKEIIDSIDISSTFGTLTVTGDASSNYITESFKVDVYGYSLASLRFQLSTVNVEAQALSNDVSIDLDYASDLTLDSFYGRTLGATLKSKSTLDIESLDLSSSLSLSMKEESTAKIGGVRSQDLRATLDNQSTLDIVSDSIENTIFTLYSDSKINISGKAKAVDLIMTQSNYYGKDCVSNSIAINVGYGKSKVEVTALDSITVNSALGDCNVTYFGKKPTITKTNISGSVVIESGESLDSE